MKLLNFSKKKINLKIREKKNKYNLSKLKIYAKIRQKSSHVFNKKFPN